MSQDKPQHGFKGVWIPKVIWQATDISWMDKCILAEIDSLDNGEGCWADDEYLGGRFGVTGKTIANRVSILRSKGYLVTVRFDGRRRWLKIVPSSDGGNPDVPKTGSEGFPKTGSEGFPKTGSVYKRDTKTDTKTDTNSLTSAVKPPTYEDEDVRLANLLQELIVANYPFAKLKGPAYKAYEAVNRLHRLDGYEYPVIEVIIRWSQQDEFWRQNIRSTATLRKQFETLLVRAKADGARRNKSKMKVA